MSQWHRNHPELVGTDADPWMIHEGYRKLVPPPAEDLLDLQDEANDLRERRRALYDEWLDGEGE